jgi:predicted Zn-dependent protease
MRTIGRGLAVGLALALLLGGCGRAPIAQAVFGSQQARAGAEAARALEEQGALLGDPSRLLAGVVGHEIGHIVARHPSREQETEADEIGQRLAAASGWDPLGITRVMDALGAEQKLSGGDSQQRSFLSTHPASAERSERTRRHAASLTRAAKPPIASGGAEFLAQLEGLVVGAGAKQGGFEAQGFLHPELGFAMRFPGPPGWDQVNTSAAVAAARENPDALILLELVAQGDDPLAAAREHVPGSARLEADPEPVQVNQLAGARARASLRGGGQPLRADLWWIALDGKIYRVTGLADQAHHAGLAALFAACAGSFHRLTAGERAAISEDRLGSALARQGETLAGLLERTGSRWKPEEAAVANALSPEVRLSAGQRVKVTRPEPYRP